MFFTDKGIVGEGRKLLVKNTNSDINELNPLSYSLDEKSIIISQDQLQHV